MKPALNSKLALNLLGVSIVMILISMVLIQLRSAKNKASVEHVLHTHAVLHTTAQLLTSLHLAKKYAAEVDTTDESFLKFGTTVASVDSLLHALRTLTIDNLVQTKLLDNKVIPLTRAQLELWEKQMKEYAAHHFSDIPMRGSTSAADSLYTHIHYLVAHEKELLSTREQQVRNDFQTTDILRTSFLSLILGICSLAFFTIRRQQRENRSLVARLQEANAALESRVEHRTNLLEKRNRKLTESFDRIRSLNESIDEHNHLLQESLKEVQFLYDQAPCCYHSIDQSGIIVRMNKTGLSWFGYSADEVIGKLSVSQILTSDSLAKRGKDLERLKELGHLENVEYSVVRKDGSVFPVLLNTIAYYDSVGKFKENRSTLFDISDRKTLEYQLQEANAFLTRLNEEKNRFIGMATHDLKNPVNGIGGLIQLMKIADNLNSEQLEYLAYMEKTVVRMNGLIENLLDLNRIEHGTDIVNAQMVDAKEVVSKIIDDFGKAAAQKEIELILQVQENVREVNTDPSLLNQVLDNLVSNAIKFSPFGKKVWLRVKKLGAYYIFEVEDQGPGINQDEIPKLFGTFQRLSARPTAGESSTGLGLSIVKGIVAALNGEIKVTSEVGKGSVFLVLIKNYSPVSES